MVETSLVIIVVLMLFVSCVPLGFLLQDASRASSSIAESYVMQRRPGVKLSRSQAGKYRGNLCFCMRSFTLEAWCALCAP